MDAKKTKRIIIRFALYIFAAAYLVTSMRSGEPIRCLPADWIMCEGDVVLLGSSTMRAKILKFIDGGTCWLHCGVAVAKDAIVHADPKCGVVRQTMAEYLAANNVDCVCLLRPYTGDGKIATSFALKCAERGVAFDNSFCYGKGDGMYCTELVLRAWESAGIEILHVNPGDRIMPSSLARSSRLHCVKERMN